MYQVTEETLKEAYKPFDIVSDSNGSVGFIREVSVNSCQPDGHQISYAIEWLFGSTVKVAWFDHSELKRHCNLMLKIAEGLCHPFGNNKEYVSKLISF